MKQSGSSPASEESNAVPDKYFNELRKENYENTFQPVEAWLRNIHSKNLNKNSERKFSNMKNYFKVHRIRLAYTFLVLAFSVAACNYPVTQQEIVGDVLTWKVSTDNTNGIKKIQSLDWFKNGEYNYNEENINGSKWISYSFVIPKESSGRDSDFKKQLENIEGVTDVKLIPISETVKRPVYAALLNGIFRIDINASNMSDDELRGEVSSQLKNAGVENAQISFEKTPEGKRMIRLFIPEHQMKKDSGFDMTIKDGNNISRLKEIRKDGPEGENKFKGKSDQEIRDMVRQDIDPALKDDQIDIFRKGDDVMIKVNKIDKVKNGKIETEEEIK